MAFFISIPSPIITRFTVQTDQPVFEAKVYQLDGIVEFISQTTRIDANSFSSGLKLINVIFKDGPSHIAKVKKN